MKKILSIILTLMSVICIAFSFGGCGEKQSGKQDNEKNRENQQTQGANDKVDGDNNQSDEKIEVKGKFYILETAYENGWLSENDLKSIACGYYELYQFDIYSDYENLYSGMFDPQGELSKEKEKELKQAYLNQIVKESELSTDGVTIQFYYGTFNGNTVVGVLCNYFDEDKTVIEEYVVGGVIFYSFTLDSILVYHIDS